MRAILTYHSIDESGSPISVSARAFESHLAWLSSGPVRVLSLPDLVAETTDDCEDAVAVTFDDGFLNTRAPILSLRAAGIPVTVFVVTGHVGGTNAWCGRDQPGIPTDRLMDWEDLADLMSAGVRLESHTRSHRSLPTLAERDIDVELQGSVEDLASRFGLAPSGLAYPFGEASAGVRASAARFFRYGCTTSFETLDSKDGTYALPRLDMYYFNRPGLIERWGSRAFARRLRWVQARRWIRHFVR